MLVLKVGFPQTGSSIPVLEHGTKFAARLSEDAVSRAGTGPHTPVGNSRDTSGQREQQRGTKGPHEGGLG